MFCYSRVPTDSPPCIGTAYPNGDIPSVTFEPQFWPGHAPWKYYTSIAFYWDWTAHGNSVTPEQVASDYVVLIIDVPGNDTGLGWLGSRTFDTSWNDLEVFTHVGYPKALDPTDSTPISESFFSIVNVFTPEDNCVPLHGLSLRTYFSIFSVLFHSVNCYI